MKKFLIQFLGLTILIFGALALSTGKVPNLFTPVIQQPKVSTATINGIKITIELADTPDKRKKGLSGRGSLEANSGMLFIFQKPDIYNFWMKDTKIPLDMIWIKEEKVVDISKNATPPTPGQKDETLSIYTPTALVDSVLEVNGGFADSHGIKVGDTVELGNG